MGLVVNTNIAGVNAARIVRRSTGALRKSLERLSSGLRINRAADDAAGLAIAEGLNSQVRGFKVAQRNAQDGISLAQIAEGALSEIGSMMQRIRELAVQAANGVNSAENRTALQNEATELVAAITDTINQTDFNGLNPFAALGADIQLQTGVNQGDLTTMTGFGSVAFTATSLNIGAISFATQATSGAAITSIDSGLDVLNAKRATLGAVQNRLEFTINVLAIKEENSLASESAIRDADIARETIDFTRNQILVSSGTSILAQANIVPQTALQLLG